MAKDLRGILINKSVSEHVSNYFGEGQFMKLVRAVQKETGMSLYETLWRVNDSFATYAQSAGRYWLAVHEGREEPPKE